MLRAIAEIIVSAAGQRQAQCAHTDWSCGNFFQGQWQLKSENCDPFRQEPEVILPENNKAAVWKRGAFNGHCRIIVASPEEAGEFNLKVSADGLQGMEVKLRAE